MEQGRIGIIGAMNEEIERLLVRMKDIESSESAGIPFHTGTLHGVDLVVCKCGVGKVNAAVCTEILISRFQAKHILFTGVAGALDPRLEIGDLVISVDCVQHDIDASALGFPRGTIPYADQSRFAADPEWVDLAMECGSRIFGDQCRLLKGTVCSGDQFIADRDKVRFLHDEFGGACTEMEGAAVGQVCSMHRVPFVIIRSISDKADGSAEVNFNTFLQKAADHSVQLVDALVRTARDHFK